MKNIDFSKMQPADVIRDASVRESFIGHLTRIHHIPQKEAEGIYKRELNYYTDALTSVRNLSSALPASVASSFLEIAIQNLSIAPGSKSEAFLECRAANGGTDQGGKTIWLSIARLVITAYGELALRIRCGQLISCSNPIVVYEGDTFQPMTNDNGDLIVKYAPAIPRVSDKIVGCWCKLVKAGNVADYKWLLLQDINRLMGYSDKANRNKGANALYSSNNGQIDAGFLEAKTMKHAFKTLPKLHLSTSVVTETEKEYEIEAAAPQFTRTEAPANIAVPDDFPAEDPEEIF